MISDYVEVMRECIEVDLCPRRSAGDFMVCIRHGWPNSQTHAVANEQIWSVASKAVRRRSIHKSKAPPTAAHSKYVADNRSD